MASANDVAAYILQLHEGSMSTMKLQKLCYYSQGFSLAWDEAPLFNEEIEAWANGPVVYELYRQHRGAFSVSSWESGNPQNLTTSQRDTIQAVVEGYGHLSGYQLSEMTHNERPWLHARGDLPQGARSANSLDLEVMQDYFGGVADANRP